jgi:hypothetical protein
VKITDDNQIQIQHVNAQKQLKSTMNEQSETKAIQLKQSKSNQNKTIGFTETNQH